MLLEHLVNDAAWLSRRLDFAGLDDFAREAAVGLLYFVRRYSAKLLYEIELHGDVEPEEMPARYVEWLREATKIEPSPADFLADVDAGSTRRATCAPGRSTRSSGRSYARSSGARGSRGRRRAPS